MLNTYKVDGYTVTVEGTWYEVSNGTDVIAYGNVEAGTTPTQVYELLRKKGELSADVNTDTGTKDTYVYLPNKHGAYHSVRVPQYVKDILANVKHLYDYTYKLTGVNPVRPGYGIEDDLKKLEAWVAGYHSDFAVKKLNGHNRRRRGVDFFITTSALFEMTDPVAHQLENARLI